MSTYHRSKGLEWPVVILTGLDNRTRLYGVGPDAPAPRLQRGIHHRVFSAAPESNVDTFDARAPLAGRWLRLWPWPYASNRSAQLAADAANTDEARRATDGEVRESLRLLYVGFTRARDHLILAARRDAKTGALKAGWLESLDGGSTLAQSLSAGEGERAITLGATRFGARIWKCNPNAASRDIDASAGSRTVFAAAPITTNADSFRIAPSDASGWPNLPAARVTRRDLLSGRVEFRLGRLEASDAGSAIHHFLAGDRYDLSVEERAQRAQALLVRAGMETVVPALQLVAASDAMRGYLVERWPTAIWHREMPIVGAISSPAGRRQSEGRIDLLLELPDGWVIVDHKSFPGAQSTWEQKALEVSSQLAAYRYLIQMSDPRPVLACLVHLTIAGGMVELAFAQKDGSTGGI